MVKRAIRDPVHHAHPPATQLKLFRLLPTALRQRLESQPVLAAILVNIGWLFVDKVLRMGGGLLVAIWVARYLGPEQFGQWSYAVALAGLFGVAAGLGLNGIVVRDLVREPTGANATLGTAMVLLLLASPVAVALMLGVVCWLRPDDALTLSMVAVLGLGMLCKFSEVVKFWFESQVQSRHSVWVENGAFLVLAGVKLAMVAWRAPLMAFVWAGFAEAALVAAGLLAIYGARGHRMRAWKPQISRAATLLKDSWPLMLSGLAIMVYMRIDQIMLGEMLGDKEVGTYSAAVRLSEIWYFIPVMIASSVFPSAIEARKHSEALYYRRLQTLFNLMAFSAIVIAVPMSFCSGWIVTTLYGSEYRQAGSVLAINIWAGVFVFLGVASSNWLLSENLQLLSFYRTALGALVNIALNFLLIPKYGAQGAAVATLVSQVVAAFCSDLLSRKTRVIFFMKLKALSLGML